MESKALALYRRIFRVARTWKGGHEEQTWIKEEARFRFRDNMGVTDAHRIEELIQAGHNQVDVAIHYQVPYPRETYADPGMVPSDGDFFSISERSGTSAVKSKRHGRMKGFIKKRR